MHPPAMNSIRLAAIVALSAVVCRLVDEPKLPGIGAAMQEMIGSNEIAGAVTVVLAKDHVLHWRATAWPMSPRNAR